MILVIGLILFVILIFTALIVYVAITKAKKHNQVYEIFAKEHNYAFDKAMGRVASTTNTKNTMNLGIEVFRNPLIDKYANFNSYPFDAGTSKIVSYVIEGVYMQQTFRAFNYQFVGSVLDKKGAGGNFAIVMISCQEECKGLANEPNVFFEKNWLCHFEEGDLKVDTIHSRIEQLSMMKREQ